MSYLGPRQIIRTAYRDKYIPGIGTFTVPAGAAEATLHFYRCETCGEEAPGQLICSGDSLPTEPFRCRCGAWIGVEMEGTPE